MLEDLRLARIYIRFSTRKDEEELPGPSQLFLTVPVSRINYNVGGTERDWVEQTGREIETKLKSLSLGYLYKPLEIFRVNFVVRFLSWGTGLLSQIISLSILADLYGQENEPTEEEIRRNITSQTSIGEKFDTYTWYLFGGGEEQAGNVILEPLFELGGSLLIFLFVVIIGYQFFPRLVPKSGILIGAYETRWRKYNNLIRLIVFTGIFGGFISYLITIILTSLFT